MVKAVVCGAAGGIGQPLSLFLKNSTLIDELVLHDVFNLPGVLADLSHISSAVKVTGYPSNPLKLFDPDTENPKIYGGADIVVIPAGMPRKPGMTRDDLFKVNASIVRGLVDAIATHAPNAFILVISNPVNSLVPVAAQALKAKGVFNAQRLFGITTLDVVRAKTFVAELAGIKNPQDLTIPVIGGHSAHTIVPILSLAKPSVNVPMSSIKHPDGVSQLENVGTQERVMGFTNVIERIQFGGDEVVGAKLGGGSATLSMAYAAFVFTEKVLQAAKGTKGIVECSYVYLPGVPGGDVVAKQTGCDFFSMPIELGQNGAEKVVNILDSLSPEEKEMVKKCTDGYTKSIPKLHTPVYKKNERNQIEFDKKTGDAIIEKWTVTDAKEEFQAGLKTNIEKGVNFKPETK